MLKSVRAIGSAVTYFACKKIGRAFVVPFVVGPTAVRIVLDGVGEKPDLAARGRCPQFEPVMIGSPPAAMRPECDLKTYIIGRDAFHTLHQVKARGLVSPASLEFDQLETPTYTYTRTLYPKIAAY